MGKVLKALDGWKLTIGVAALFIFKVWDSYHNGHTGDIVGSVLAVLNWLPNATGPFTADGIGLAASSGVIVVGFFAKLWKAQKQIQAGATLAETGGSVGIIKAAVADGTLKVAGFEPAVLKMTDTAPKAGKETPPVVAVLIAEPTMK